VATGLRNVQGLALTANKLHLLAAESTARSLAVFSAQPADGAATLVRAADIALPFAPSALSHANGHTLAAGHVQALRSALLGRRAAVDSVVAAVPDVSAEQCAQGGAFQAHAILDVKRAAVTASLFATASALVVATESQGVRVCFSN
jgi:hypothetical protein